jgi:hypothetical protein
LIIGVNGTSIIPVAGGCGRQLRHALALGCVALQLHCSRAQCSVARRLIDCNVHCRGNAAMRNAELLLTTRLNHGNLQDLAPCNARTHETRTFDYVQDMTVHASLMRLSLPEEYRCRLNIQCIFFPSGIPFIHIALRLGRQIDLVLNSSNVAF